jgi:tol-pal system protein YbgF
MNSVRITSATCLLALAATAQAQAPVTDRDGSSLAARVERLEQQLESRGLLDMLQQLEALQQQVSQIRGDMELQMHTLEEIRARQRDLYADIDRRLQRLEGGGAGGAAEPETFGGPAAGNEPPLETLGPLTGGAEPIHGREAESALTVQPMEPQQPEPEAAGTVGMQPGEPQVPAAAADTGALAAVAPASDPVRARADYERAFTLLKQSRYDQAAQAFRDFLATHGNSEYAGNAQYWLGETYYVTRDFESALAEYQRVVTDHPDSQKVPDAMLKMGFALQELGRLDEARTTLEDVTRRYPSTTAARLASERLNFLRSSAPPASPGR